MSHGNSSSSGNEVKRHVGDFLTGHMNGEMTWEWWIILKVNSAELLFHRWVNKVTGKEKTENIKR